MPSVIMFGSWLQQRRKALGFTQADLAARIGCSPQTIYKIEAGQRRPSEQIAVLLAEHLQIAAQDYDGFIQFARAEPGSMPIDPQLLHAPWRMQFLPPHNLPTQLTTFVGGASTVKNAVQILKNEATRLLTLVGPPGVGKTRLSIEVGQAVVGNFRDGTFFIPLGEIADPELLASTIAHTLDIFESTSRLPWEGLKRYLYEREILLILDNFEQLLPAAPRVTDLLSACPLVKVLVTSREPLQVRGERRFRVPTLSLPPVDEQPLETVAASTAVDLFVQRAQAVQPDFSLTTQNARSLAELCIQLDGLPLAIEIVSVRIDVLPLEKLVVEMQGSRLLQADGWRDADARHHTLNAAIGWSYHSLPSHEQHLFRHLGIFAGGATLDAIQEVSAPTVDALPGLTSLVEKNLLITEAALKLAPRFRMLQTLREYALWQLKTSGEFEDLQQRFVYFFSQWANLAENELRGHQQAAWIEKVDGEHTNLRAVLDFYVNENLWDAALHMAGALFEFWVYRGYISEGQRRLQHLLNVTTGASVNAALRAKVLNGAAMLSYFAGDYATIQLYSEAALAIGRSLSDHWNIALASMSLGMALAGQRLFDQALNIFQAGLEAAHKTGEGWLIATLLNGLGEVARSQGDYGLASSLLQSSLDLGEACGHRWLTTHVLDNLGHVAYSQQEYDKARTLYEQSLHASLEIHDQRGVAMGLEKLGGLAATQGYPEKAARLLGAAEALRELKNAPVEGMDQRDYQLFVAQARAGLEEQHFRAAWAEGRQMLLSEAIASALS